MMSCRTQSPRSLRPAVGARCLRHRRGRQHLRRPRSCDRRARQAGAAEPACTAGRPGPTNRPATGRASCCKLPHEFFAAEADRLGFALPAPGRYGVAMLFLPRDAGAAAAVRGDACRGRREGRACGAGLARRARRQPLPGRDRPRRRAGGPAGVHRRQRPGRRGAGAAAVPGPQARRAPRGASCWAPAADEFYVPSMSCRTICYKGMFLAPQLFAYYPDLADAADEDGPGHRPPAVQHQHVPELAAGPAVPHDRPQRRDQHAAGQLPTGCGPTRTTMACPALGEDLSDLFPILEPGGSDSACFDNCMELLVRAGRSRAARPDDDDSRGLRPAATTFRTDKRAFYEYHAAIMEPWDGPAAMVFTDGRLVGGTLDRNGLRPCRYVVTTDGLVVLASEVGRDRVPARADPAQGPASAGPDVPGRHRGRPDRRRQRDQGQDRPPEALSPLAGGEPHRAAGPVPARQADRDRPRHAGRSGCGPSATPAKSC